MYAGTRNPFEQDPGRPRSPVRKTSPLLGPVGSTMFQTLQNRGGLTRQPVTRDSDERSLLLTTEDIEMMESWKLRPHEFFLKLPPDEESPSWELLSRRGPKELQMETSHYDQLFNRPYADHEITAKVLSELSIVDPNVRHALLSIVDRSAERRVIARSMGYEELFEIEDRTDEMPQRLTLQDVVMRLDRAGYRPATLRELLAYATSSWNPLQEWSDLKQYSNTTSPKVTIAFGSAIMHHGNSSIAYLSYGAKTWKISLTTMIWHCDDSEKFLVVRK